MSLIAALGSKPTVRPVTVFIADFHKHAATMPDSASIIRLHDTLTSNWHQPAWHESTSVPGDVGIEDQFLALVAAQHRENFDLWHEEDKARDPLSTDSEIACVKHAIDRFNQRRNDLIEKIDEWLLKNLPHQNETACLNSETPGLIIDRLSILALRVYHTEIEAHRETGSEEHHQRNLSRLQILQEQQRDLATCLDRLLSDVKSGLRRFKIYRQMKMYNDPTLNPAIYSHARKKGGS